MSTDSQTSPQYDQVTEELYRHLKTLTPTIAAGPLDGGFNLNMVEDFIQELDAEDQDLVPTKRKDRHPITPTNSPIPR